MKNIATLATITLFSLGLAGCSPAESFACEEFSSGEQVNSVTVSRELNVAPEVSFPSPLSSETIQREILIQGEGPTYTGANYIEFEFAAYNGGSGELLQQTSFDGTESVPGFFTAGQVPNLCSALVGAKEGSRVVAILPPADAHGGQGVEQLGVAAQDALIFIVDIKKVYLAKATGQNQLPESGVPTVVTAPEGIPGVTIPKADPPSELKISQLIRGEGALVKEGDKVTLHYSGFLWADGSKFDSSWDTGQPVQFDMLEGSLIPGFLEAIIGQPIGSQVIAVIPPALGYGDQDTGTIPGGSTLVFVVDILGVSD